MLHELLSKHRDDIIDLTKRKARELSDAKLTSREFEKGLPEFYDHLIVILKKQTQGWAVSRERCASASPTEHGRESLRLGYTISQVVHGYGAICQAVTETADALREQITPAEFNTLNLSLDVAIAAAVTEFSRPTQLSGPSGSTERIGSLVHELRNALACALVAHSMVKTGAVGVGGNTNALLERNLNRMRDLLDRSFSEIRLQSAPAAHRHPMLLIEAIEEVEATAVQEGLRKGVTLSVEAGPLIQVNVDRNYLISALSNLVQNAIKFTKRGGAVWVRSHERGDVVLLEVEDRCGGLPEGKAEEIFKPFAQASADRTGLGLGLSISRRAVAQNEGSLAVRDMPGVGCVFTITLPRVGQSALSR